MAYTCKKIHHNVTKLCAQYGIVKKIKKQQD